MIDLSMGYFSGPLHPASRPDPRGEQLLANSGGNDGGGGHRRDLEGLKAWARKVMDIDVLSSAQTFTKSETAFKVLETLITSMELAPGSQYKLEEFCEMLDLGRSPVRDALKQLEAEGLVDLKRRVGIRIREIEADDMEHLLLVRSVLEPVATRESILRGSRRHKEVIGHLGVAIFEAAAELDTRSFMHIGLMAYKQMTDATGNPFLTKHLMSVYSLSRRIYFARVREDSDVVDIGKLHHDRFQAIARSDLEAGAEATARLTRFLDRFATAR